MFGPARGADARIENRIGFIWNIAADEACDHGGVDIAAPGHRGRVAEVIGDVAHGGGDGFHRLPADQDALGRKIHIAMLLPDATPATVQAYPWMVPNFATPDGKMILSFQCFVMKTKTRKIINVTSAARSGL